MPDLDDDPDAYIAERVARENAIWAEQDADYAEAKRLGLSFPRLGVDPTVNGAGPSEVTGYRWGFFFNLWNGA